MFGGDGWERVVGPDGTKEQWYLHLFDVAQPDLNWRNPAVGDLFEEILRFWLDRGVDGFRIDVAHSLFKEEGLRDQVRAQERAGPPADHRRRGMVDPHEDDEPMWDQPEVHEVYRRWHRVLAEYPGDRMTVAEAWTKTPEAMARYVRPDELSQSFNFAWLVAPWSADGVRRRHHRTPSRPCDRSGAHPTWVLSNHDVIRHVTRYGGGERGVARGRAATLTMLSLPGSAYVYQGEELGLAQAEVPPEHRQDPVHDALRGHRARRLSGSAAVVGHRAAVRLRPGQRAAVAAAAGRVGHAHGRPAGGRRGVDAAVLPAGAAARRELAVGSGDTVEMLDLGADVLGLRRGPLTVVLNCGSVETRLPPGEVLLSSGPLLGSLLPPDTAVWLR